MRADQCRTRTHKMYKLFLESATDPKKKREFGAYAPSNYKQFGKKDE